MLCRHQQFEESHSLACCHGTALFPSGFPHQLPGRPGRQDPVGAARPCAAPRVLVMEWIDGMRCTDPEGIKASRHRCRQLHPRGGVVSGLRQLLEVRRQASAGSPHQSTPPVWLSTDAEPPRLAWH